jgi:hypothetical protein
MSTLRVDNLNARTGNNIIVPTGTVLTAPGHVIQVASVSGLSTVTSTSTSFVDVGSVSITPKFSTSRILILASTYVHRNSGNAATDYWNCAIYRNNVSTRLLTMADAVLYQSYADGTRETITGYIIDTPGTTSSVTYGMCAARQTASGSATFNQGSAGNIILMEIGV